MNQEYDCLRCKLQEECIKEHSRDGMDKLIQGINKQSKEKPLSCFGSGHPTMTDALNVTTRKRLIELEKKEFTKSRNNSGWKY